MYADVVVIYVYGDWNDERQIEHMDVDLERKRKIKTE